MSFEIAGSSTGKCIRYNGPSNYTFSPAIYCRITDIVRKPASAHSGSQTPVVSGSHLPAKVLNESIKKESQYAALEERYGSEVVRQGLAEIEGRKNRPDQINSTYLEMVIKDLAIKPVRSRFEPCELNGCKGGYIHPPHDAPNPTILICTCLQQRQEASSQGGSRYG